MCHEPGVSVQRKSQEPRPFLSAPYGLDEESVRWRPLGIIDRCPLARDGERCRIRQHDWRNRKTGPSVALRVLKCMSHHRAFTVYPPGYVPYGRQSWIPVDLCGHWVNRPVPTGKDIGFAGCEFRGMRGGEAREDLAERASGRTSAGELLDPAAEARPSGASTGFGRGSFYGTGGNNSRNFRRAGCVT